ncbi:MAG: GPR endopeptidase [Coprobacillus sp. 28_7]|nr:MAG: GPR endopeptidase [Coprobacillus sp. 28_7]
MNCENVLANVIKEVMEFENIKNEDKGLIVGLGNINVTPDSLGPLVVDNVIVTRHMFMINPSKVSPGIREVSAIAPGVMGTTGIETFDIIEAVKSKIDVDYMIVVDALASRSIDRVNKTIQITNTGISPGSGVGNRRKELSKETIGIPVIAIGVPTVVDAVTITSDTIDIIMKYMNNLHRNKPEEIDIENTPRPNKEYREELFGNVGALSEEEKRQLIDEILTPTGFNMMVTPKEVDLDISDLTQIISKAIDQALHPIVGPYEA